NAVVQRVDRQEGGGRAVLKGFQARSKLRRRPPAPGTRGFAFSAAVSENGSQCTLPGMKQHGSISLIKAVCGAMKAQACRRADRTPGPCGAGEEVAWRHSLTGRFVVCQLSQQHISWIGGSSARRNVAEAARKLQKNCKEVSFSAYRRNLLPKLCLGTRL